MKENKIAKFLHFQLLLHGAVDAQSTGVINNQAISFCKILQFVFPIDVKSSLREAIQIQRCLWNNLED